MSLTDAQRRELRLQCELTLPGFAVGTAADDFRALASWCETNGVEHDEYGVGALVQGFEAKVAALRAKEAAVFMPSGIMAQLAAIRVWTESARLPRFGIHPTAHIANHEEEAHVALLQTHAVPVGHRLRPMLQGLRP